MHQTGEFILIAGGSDEKLKIGIFPDLANFFFDQNRKDQLNSSGLSGLCGRTGTLAASVFNVPIATLPN